MAQSENINLNQIIKFALDTFQEVLDERKTNLQVSELSERDNLIGKLNWDFIITEYYASGFNCKFCFKNQHKILGAFVSRYNLDKQCLEIYGIEKFERDNFKQMLFYSLSLIYTLLSLIDGKSVKLVDVDKRDKKLIGLYKNFGFKQDRQNPNDFIQSVDHLGKIIHS